MNLEYVYAESTVKPSAIEILDGMVYLRTNIDSVERTDENENTVKYWTYQETVMTTDDFNLYSNELQSDNADNQMIIMEAIADLYAMVASLME